LRKTLCLGVLFLTLSWYSYSNGPTDKIDPANFNTVLFERIVKNWINSYRLNKGLDTLLDHAILVKASKDQAAYMAEIKKTTLEQQGSARRSTGGRVSYYGGTNVAWEIVSYTLGAKKKVLYTYNEVAETIISKILKSKRNQKIVLTPELLYIGIGTAFDSDRKKIYLSMVFGGIKTFNPGKEWRNILEYKYSTSQRGLKPGNSKNCRSCYRFTDIHQLQQGLYIKGNDIYLKYDDLRKLKRLIRKPVDGFAIDIVQKEQYQCDKANILDHELMSKGILLKPVFQKRILANNIHKNPRDNRFEGVVGTLPNGKLDLLNNEIELNFVVIQNKHFCRSISRSYVEEGDIASFIRLSILPDTVTKFDPRRFSPQPERNTLTFNIPFKKGKYRFSQKDIIPFIDALEEPKFHIQSIRIIAHSSLEGDSLLNSGLQVKRAQSIVKAIQKNRKKSYATEIQVSDSWELFKRQVRFTEFAYLALLSKAEVKSKLKDPKFAEKLESVLQKERFAVIIMSVIYDITGENEEQYVLATIRKMVREKDAAQALRLQKYAVSQVRKNRYDHNKLLAIQIPEDMIFVPLILNQIYLDVAYNHEDTLYKGIKDRFETLYNIDPDNQFVLYNRLLTQDIISNINDSKVLYDIQNKIDHLYQSRIPKKNIDALNLEFQFRLIEALDTADVVHPMVTSSLGRVKEIFNIKGGDWRNGLKLAFIFIKHGDLDYGLKLLSPFINKNGVDEKLVFNYIALAAHFEENIYKKDFLVALRRAREMNPTKYCRLFGNPYLTFQLLDHPKIKKDYCETCK